MEQDPGQQNQWKVAIAASSLVLAAACTSGYPHKNGPPPNNTAATTFASNASPSAAEFSTGPVVTPPGIPSPTATLSPENCDSIRAARLGAYFNESYKSHIDDQLRLMRVALSPNSNVDINSDFVSWVQLAHAIEDDPEYSDAMARAYNMLKQNPDTPITADELLSWDIPAPPTCAPQRLTDEASRKNLEETKTVSGGVAEGLLGHLGDQSSRLAQMAIDGFKHTWNDFEARLDTQIQQLGN